MRLPLFLCVAAISVLAGCKEGTCTADRCTITSMTGDSQSAAPTYQAAIAQSAPSTYQASSQSTSLSGYGGMYSQVRLPEDSPTPSSYQSSKSLQRMTPSKAQYNALTGACICAEYVARRSGLPNVNEAAGTNEEILQSAGYSRSAYPRPGGIALLDANIPELTLPGAKHIAFIEGADDGVPIVSESNTGGTDSGYGCTNVRTSRRVDYLAPGVTFWAKS